MTAFQLIQIIKDIHDKGYLHRDIKLENIVVGVGKNRNKLYIIDFGTAKKYINSENQHIPFKQNLPFVGTYRYAPKSIHFGHEQGRKDDLQSIGYVLIYLLIGRLPWQDLNLGESYGNE
ncbi:hypothetical protein IMG5_018820, partial [Ichthyophthirius multifiliis]